jgi:hypothetical protein
MRIFQVFRSIVGTVGNAIPAYIVHLPVFAQFVLPIDTNNRFDKPMPEPGWYTAKYWVSETGCVPTNAPRAASVPATAPRAACVRTTAPRAAYVPTNAPRAACVPTTAPRAAYVRITAPCAACVPTTAPRAAYVPATAPRAAYVPATAPCAACVPTTAPQAACVSITASKTVKQALQGLLQAIHYFSPTKHSKLLQSLWYVQ